MGVPKKTKRTVRRSISLAAELDAKVKRLAHHQRQSTNRVLEKLVETGLAAKEAEKQRFFELADQLRSSKDAAEIQKLKDELARITFGS